MSTEKAAVVAIESLRALLPPPLPQAPGMPTGVEALDDALASGGLPRGRLTEVTGATGKLTLVRGIVDAAVRRGEWVAYIDASRTLAPRDWAQLGDGTLWVVRPPEAVKAAWCAAARRSRSSCSTRHRRSREPWPCDSRASRANRMPRSWSWVPPARHAWAVPCDYA